MINFDKVAKTWIIFIGLNREFVHPLNQNAFDMSTYRNDPYVSYLISQGTAI